jgi:hypothetical protein
VAWELLKLRGCPVIHRRRGSDALALTDACFESVEDLISRHVSNRAYSCRNARFRWAAVRFRPLRRGLSSGSATWKRICPDDFDHQALRWRRRQAIVCRMVAILLLFKRLLHGVQLARRRWTRLSSLVLSRIVAPWRPVAQDTIVSLLSDYSRRRPRRMGHAVCGPQEATERLAEGATFRPIARALEVPASDETNDDRDDHLFRLSESPSRSRRQPRSRLGRPALDFLSWCPARLRERRRFAERVPTVVHGPRLTFRSPRGLCRLTAKVHDSGRLTRTGRVDGEVQELTDEE